MREFIEIVAMALRCCRGSGTDFRKVAKRKP
jgi:hypothetical protein